MSDLAFIQRVLEEAENRENPVLERVRFLAITGTLLDEFYRFRVPTLHEQPLVDDHDDAKAQARRSRQLVAVDERSNELLSRQDDCWAKLCLDLRKAGIAVIDESEVSTDERKWLDDFFAAELKPQLNPVMFSNDEDFPFVRDGELFFVIELSAEEAEASSKAILHLPTKVPRFVPLPGDSIRFVSLETVLGMFTNTLFEAHQLTRTGLARIIRDGTLTFRENEENLLRQVGDAIAARDRARVIRLKVDGDMPEPLRRYLAMIFGLVDESEAKALRTAKRPVAASRFVAVDNLLGLADTMQLPRGLSKRQRARLTFTTPAYRRAQYWQEHQADLLDTVAEKDRILHFPYDDFHIFTAFLTQAASDPNVTRIKQTLYRSGHNSRIVKALALAARNGKEVTVLIELKAREDELENIKLAKRLASAGCTVIYGPPQHKVHAKVLIVERQEDGLTRRYVNLSTGNYYAKTAKSYTDLSLLTADPAMASDVDALFEFAANGVLPTRLSNLSIAPIDMRDTLTTLIEKEISHARDGKPAAIWLKVNRLSDPEIIEMLYSASRAGVEIDLLVRGICRLRPGVSGMSERIRVRSVVGRFLEHSRVFCFGNGDYLPSPNARVYLSSADLMPHKLDGRIEAMFPVLDADNRMQVQEIMTRYWRDEAKTWSLAADGAWTRAGVDGFNAQHSLMFG